MLEGSTGAQVGATACGSTFFADLACDCRRRSFESVQSFGLDTKADRIGALVYQVYATCKTARRQDHPQIDP